MKDTTPTQVINVTSINQKSGVTIGQMNDSSLICNKKQSLFDMIFSSIKAFIKNNFQG